MIVGDVGLSWILLVSLIGLIGMLNARVAWCIIFVAGVLLAIFNPEMVFF